MSGEVRELARIEPKKLELSGNIDAPISGTIRLEPVQPFAVTDVSAKPGQYISTKWEKKTSEDGTTYYEILVTNTATQRVRYYERLVVETDKKDIQPFRITVIGDIQDK